MHFFSKYKQGTEGGREVKNHSKHHTFAGHALVASKIFQARCPLLLTVEFGES